MKEFTFIKRFLKSSVVGDFYMVLKAPVDKETVRTIKPVKPYDHQSSIIRETNQNFTDYIFQNLIISQKGRSYSK